MHDIKTIRENPAQFDAALALRGAEPASANLLALDEKRRELSTRLQQAQSRRNEASKAIGKAMGQGDKEAAEALKAEVAEIKQSMPAMEEQDAALQAELNAALAILPNSPAADVPLGGGEEDNVEVALWGTPREFSFEAQEHADIGPALGMDFETGTRLSGARFTFLRGNMARLHRALGQFMLDQQTGEYGYSECMPPVLVKDEAMYGTDKLPKFAEDSFQTSLNSATTVEALAYEAIAESLTNAPDDQLKGISATELVQLIRSSTANAVEKWAEPLDKAGINRRWLIPTAEVSLAASVMGEILEDAALPIRMTALTQCFRSEAGSAGRDTRGFIRQHQFEKCELVSVVRPEESEAEHERMTGAAEAILQKLDLPYRKVLLCTGDMGFGARKTYDLEVWLPGQSAYREISSCSNTGDFQSRRMNTRYRPEGEKKTAFTHTLNGSGLAVGRTLVAVIENYQQEDGSVLVPEILSAYMGGVTKLDPAT